MKLFKIEIGGRKYVFNNEHNLTKEHIINAINRNIEFFFVGRQREEVQDVVLETVRYEEVKDGENIYTPRVKESYGYSYYMARNRKEA